MNDNNNQTALISRRELLKRGAALSTLASAQIAWPGWMPRLSFATDGTRGDVLVNIFLRGGADGLNVIVPHGEAEYYKVRAKLGIARPDDTKAAADQRALDLDGFFGLNPMMQPLLPIFKGGQMTAIHATGSPDPTRSHFDAMSYMERGTPGSYALGTGWIGRHLVSFDTGNMSAVRAIGWNATLPASLRGSVNAVAIKSIVDYHLQGRKDAGEQLLTALNAMYAVNADALTDAAEQTNAVLELVSKISIADYKSSGGATYSDGSDFDMALMQTAALIKADVGLEVAAIDLGGWDTHQNQLQSFATDLGALAQGLAAFHADLGDLINKVTIVVMSEFGRRVQENASGGTDHGHGNMMLVMGGNVAPKPVIAEWPGLAREKLYQNEDLAVTIDYRDVLSEILQKRLNNMNLAAVFPDFTPTPRGVVR